MNTAERKILVGVDGTGPGLAAVRWAAAVAARRRLKLLIVHALRADQPAYGAGLAGPVPWYGDLAEEGRRVLDEATEQARAVSPETVVDTIMPTDSPAPYLIDASKSAALVVVGGTGRGFFNELTLGSTASAVVAHAHCPVVVMRGKENTTAYPAEGPVVVGIDGSPLSERALEVAFEEASWRNARLVAVHAWRDVTYDDAYGMARLVVQWESIEEEERRLLAQRLAGWQEKYPDVEVERVLVRDQPRHILLEWSAKAQLVVVGSRGRGGFTGQLLGSTSQALAHHAECPVMVVRPEKSR
ncbi:universal stress protein [Amycolatopsis orientalis]|uniref:universal stress protein n=1 Tax=Amycolatopsis orientalis TaxID=31958 RepID=UPI0003FF05D0|nr:universal stress protein [Amycolatopsis orientalis]